MSAGPFLYVPNTSDSTVSVVDTSTDTVVATIPLSGKNSDGAAVSPNGALVYVASESGIVSVISTATNSVVATIPVGHVAYTVEFSPDGSLAYVVGGDYVSVINTATSALVTNITVGSAAYSVAISPDGSHAYVTGGGLVSVIDTANNSVVASIDIGNAPTGVAVSPDGTVVYASNYGSGTVSVIDTATNSVAATINVGTNPYGVVFSPDGHHAYVATYGGTVAVIDTATNSVVTSIDVGPSVGITISPDGTHVYVSHYTSSDTVSIIDTATNTVTGSITVGTGPEYLAISGSAPVIASPDRAHVDLQHTLSVDAIHGVLANDTDPLFNDTLTVSAVNGQSGNVGHALAGTYGTVTLNADGSYSYTAASNFHFLPEDGVGLDTFTYTARDGAGVTANTTLTFVVTEPDKTYLGGNSGVTINGANVKEAVLDGGAGKDVLLAGKGEAVLIGGPGDTLTGGNGADTFVFAPNFGANTITNFNTEIDKIQLPHSEFANFAQVLADAHQVGANTVIAHGNDVLSGQCVAKPPARA
jgi:YVTN family beta-propeller protein/VCBS repeat-containing protein